MARAVTGNTTPTAQLRNPTLTDNRRTGKVPMARPTPWKPAMAITVRVGLSQFVSMAFTDINQPEMAQQPPGGGTTGILNKCKEINDGISDIRSKREGQLTAAQNALLDSSTEKEDQTARQTVDYIEDEVNNGFRYLRDLLKRIKQTPGSGDPRVQTQIDVTVRNLQREIQQYQRAQSDFQKRLREQVRRRYEIANPEATPEELDQGVDSVLMGQEQTFQVWLLLSFCLSSEFVFDWLCRLPGPAPVKPTMRNAPLWNARRPSGRLNGI